MKRCRIGVDIGGTFTDLVLFDEETGDVRLTKESTTKDLVIGILKCIEKADASLKETTLFINGSTVAINAILQAKGGKKALITTKGFRDILEIGGQNRKEMYNLFFRKPVPLVPRELR